MSINLVTKNGITQMYQTYFSKIYNYIYYRVYNHEISSDIVSGVFLRVLEHANDFDPSQASFETWLYAIARHALIDHFRTRREDCDLEDYTDALEYSLDFEEAYLRYTQGPSGDVSALMAVLSDMEQRIIHMRYFQGYSGKETAQSLGLNASTERTIHERALKKMLRYLKAQGVTAEDMLSPL